MKKSIVIKNGRPDIYRKSDYPTFYLNIRQDFCISRSGNRLCKVLSLRSSTAEMFIGIFVLKICSKFSGEHTSRNVILIKLQSNFIEITLLHECYGVNVLHRTPFYKNTSGWMLLYHSKKMT